MGTCATTSPYSTIHPSPMFRNFHFWASVSNFVSLSGLLRPSEGFLNFLICDFLAGPLPPRCPPDASQFPPSPGGVQDSLPPGAQTKKTFWLFCDLKKWPPKVQPKVSKWSPQMAKIRSKFDKMPALELVLENAWKNDEKPCLWILKNSGFAWERLHFSRFPVSSKSWEN